MKTLLIVSMGGPLCRRTRWQIENAPTELVIKVARVPKEVSGARVHTVVFDELEDNT